MTNFKFTPQLFKASLGLLGMSMREFCAESGVSLTRMSEFQNDPETRLTSKTIHKILSFAQSRGVKISEEGVTFIRRMEELNGVEGLKRLYDEVYETLSNGGELRSYNLSSDALIKILGYEFFASHIKRMTNTESGIVGKSLAHSGDSAIERPYMHYKLLQQDDDFKQSMLIFEDKVAFIKLTASEAYVLLHRDQDMAAMSNRLFDFSWAQALDLELIEPMAPLYHQAV